MNEQNLSDSVTSDSVTTVRRGGLKMQGLTQVAVAAGLIGVMLLGPRVGMAAEHHAKMTLHGHRPVAIHLVPRGEDKRPVTFNGVKTPIRAVMALVFRRSGQNYVFGPHVRGVVTANLHAVPFDTAVEDLVKANSVPLTMAVKNGVYIINARNQPPIAPLQTHPRAETTTNGRTTYPTRRRRTYPVNRRPNIPYRRIGVGGAVRIAP